MTTRPDLTKLRAKLEDDLSEIIAPELIGAGAKGFYITMSSEVPSLDFHGSIGGMFHPDCVHWFCNALEPRWRGVGPALLVCDGPNCSAAKFVAVALHETSHAVLSRPMFSVNSEPEVVLLVTLATKSLTQRPLSSGPNTYPDRAES